MKQINEPIYQTLVDNQAAQKVTYVVGKKFVYRIHQMHITQQNKHDVIIAKFIKGSPHGELIIQFKDHTMWHPQNINQGRVFDFIQSVAPQPINTAGYDYNMRHEFPQLLDPDHAVEIDKLRKYMQEGHISHYEYDDYNPAYPKAGK